MIKQRTLFLLVVFIFLIAFSGYKLYLQSAASGVYTGTLEATKTDITPKMSGYLETIFFDEGSRVSAGQAAALLEHKSLDAQLLQDKAALAKAQATLVDLEKGARPEELREAAANTAAALSVYEKAHVDRLRYRELLASGAISQQQYDDINSSCEVAENTLTAAQEKENLLLAGNRGDVILAQQQEVQRAAAVLQETQISVGYSSVYMPAEGLILTKNYENGEYVGAGASIGTIVDLTDCWVKIYVSSDMLGKIKIGQPAAVKIDAYPNRDFSGTIKEISDTAEFTPRQSITKHERANLVFGVKIALPNEDEIFKPGMVADVVLE